MRRHDVFCCCRNELSGRGAAFFCFVVLSLYYVLWVYNTE